MTRLFIRPVRSPAINELVRHSEGRCDTLLMRIRAVARELEL
jgi:hypothetical protein